MYIQGLDEYKEVNYVIAGRLTSVKEWLSNPTTPCLTFGVKALAKSLVLTQTKDKPEYVFRQKILHCSLLANSSNLATYEVLKSGKTDEQIIVFGRKKQYTSKIDNLPREIVEADSVIFPERLAELLTMGQHTKLKKIIKDLKEEQQIFGDDEYYF